MYRKISIKVNSEITAPDKILLWFEQLNSPHICDRDWWQCQTLLQEGFANIVEHAHKDLPAETPITIEAERNSQYIEIRILSHGPTFDLEHKLREIPKLEDNDSEGGRGLRIMEIFADSLSYERTIDNHNCLRMQKIIKT